jgi:predicted N-acetyltransferase YhbS
MHHDRVEIRIGDEGDVGRARDAYEHWGYHGGVLPSDCVFLAERGGDLVGVVRLSNEEGVQMLRGMQIAPQERRRGTGTRLLHALVERLSDSVCYCVPFSHLVGFYGQAGFEEIPLGDAPLFLVERIARYRDEGHVVTLMRRPAQADSRPRRPI